MTAPTHIGRLLEGAAARMGAGERVAAAQVLEAATEALQTVFGPVGAAAFRPATFRHGQLHVVAGSSPAAAALRSREREVLVALNARHRRTRVERIVVRPS